MTLTPLQMLWWMIVGHAVCDYPLQGDFLAKGKNRKNPIPGVPWFICLLAHSLIHGGMVALVTGSIFLGIAETGWHAVIDLLKCEGVFGFKFDQFLHIFFKMIWAFAAIGVLKMTTT